MFYICPPDGRVSLNTLENCVFARLEYLNLLHRGEAANFRGSFQYLLEGCLCDKVGHFVLRLLVSTSDNLWNCWLARERLLLKHRLDHITTRELHRLFRSVIRQVQRRGASVDSIDKVLMRFCAHFLQPRIFNHIVDPDHSAHCETHYCMLRFEAVYDLVETRLVDVRDGLATIPCSQWKKALESLFQSFLESEKLRSRSGVAERLTSGDIRLSSMRRKVHRRMLGEGSARGSLTVENIDREAEKFPLCMRHLHATLRSRHRLSHHARFYYSLFLKECGMKLADAVEYWKREYSKPHVCTSGCSHNWQTDGKKFLYSIRHLYGLEGSRKHYKTPDCSFICREFPGPRYEGGCPFKSFDADTLKGYLRASLNEIKATEHLEAKTSQTPETACAEFYKSTSHKCDEDVTINSPVQYYLMTISSK